ncbi:MAG: ATP-binding protein [Lachnospiraceae bacterium]|nr:ATP-binding protein [Lachnospiraceae bacterium]
MTIHEAIFSPLRQPLLIILYLLLTLQMTLFFSAFRDVRSRRYKLFLLLHMLLSFICLWMPLWDLDSNPYRTDRPIPLPAARTPFTSLPVSAMFFYEVMTAVILVCVIRDSLRYRKDHLTSDSVKEAIDLLPAGIAFGKEDGTAVFGNLVMNDLARKLTGKSLTDLSAFLDDKSGNAVTDIGKPVQVTLPDTEQVWQLFSDMTEADGERFIRLTATDITKQAAVTRELEEKNKKLKDIHMRLDIYNKQADRIIIAQELLTARMAVHNEVGNILLESRHYMKDPSSIDEEVLLQALKNTNTYLLREYEEDDTARDPLTDALEMARAIGVRVKITGSVPEEGTAREILAAAINECATNTVKHADSDWLSVEIRQEGPGLADQAFCFVLQSSGAAGGKVQPGETAPEDIHESGGLLSLRTLVEREGGAMQIESAPEFRLTIRLNSVEKQVL